MPEGLDLTQAAFIELLQTFKCTHNIALCANAMTVTCVLRNGVVIYSIYDLGDEYKILCQAFVNNKPLDAKQAELDSYLEVCNLIIDDLTALDDIMNIEDIFQEVLDELEESDD